MAKSKSDSNNLVILDAAALLLSLWFVYTVIGNARELIEDGIKSAPQSYALIGALILVAVSYFKSKKLSVLSIIVLAVLATSAAIWLFGLSTNQLF